MPRRTGLFALAAASIFGCGVEGPPPALAPPPPAPLVALPRGSATAGADSGPRAPFQNPGGMWMPEQLREKADELKALGLEVDPASLADPTSSTLSAVVSLGGCSA